MYFFCICISEMTKIIELQTRPLVRQKAGEPKIWLKAESEKTADLQSSSRQEEKDPETQKGKKRKPHSPRLQPVEILVTCGYCSFNCRFPL
ncbi:hypothetical protein AVEN_100296-1 [Araneus ventricosus]|uniref:Uncharacterized protein n=1 Tax=Araneus ventricosus TaxID=182803 RepID=A0A4Y2WL42_ARAVE|nr:hypothetical protein AVEN_22664-1 [Araneus ventricosus]GBO37427.1 hypothetical protein AVEN_100296-1 [Araneus ventricosus]